MSLPALLADLPPYALVITVFAVLAAYTIFGATGFGASLVAVPFLAHAFPIAFAVPLVTCLDVFAATSTSVLIGITLGATLIVKLPAAVSLGALGVFVACYGTYLIAGPRSLRQAPDWLAWPIGIVGGVFSALFGTGGPVYMVFLTARLTDKAALRATSAAMITVSAWLRLAVFGTAGLMHPTLLVLAAAGVPAMLLGLFLGNRLHHALSGRAVLRLIAGLLVVNGISLVLRALGEWRSG
jgi:uncharacterized protein